MVKSKTKSIPEWIVNLVITSLDEEIKKRTGVKISLLNPAEFIINIHTPIYCILGNEDELIQ